MQIIIDMKEWMIFGILSYPKIKNFVIRELIDLLSDNNNNKFFAEIISVMENKKLIELLISCLPPFVGVCL